MENEYADTKLIREGAVLGKLRFFASITLVCAGFVALLAAPLEAIAGAKQGLSVCAQVIVPSLFPFLVLSGMLTALGLPTLLARPLGPVMRRLFGVSGASAVPFLLGLTGGYPVGAAVTAELVRDGSLDRAEGERVLAFCNNTGPAFIIGAAGAGIFASPRIGLALYLSHMLAAVCVGLILSRHKTGREARPSTALPRSRLPEALAKSVRNAAASVVSICGFVVFFSVLRALLDALGLFSSCAGALSLRFGAELRFCRALLSGLLELGSGISAMAGLEAAPRNLALASFLLGFGGLSVHCQTLAAVDGSGMRLGHHLGGRLLHGLCSAGITLLLTAV